MVEAQPARIFSALAFGFHGPLENTSVNEYWIRHLMKKVLGLSILLNLVLLGGAMCLLAIRQKEWVASRSVWPGITPSRQDIAAAVRLAPVAARKESFHWSQLMSDKDYRRYIANLRAIGCPEATIEEIVQGDTARTFAWERRQLALDESGDGPWSQQTEKQLVVDLLGQPEFQAGTDGARNSKYVNEGDEKTEAPRASLGVQSGEVRYPLFLQNENWGALGFTADQQEAIARVRQQFQSEINNANSLPGGVTTPNSGMADPVGSSSSSQSNEATTRTPWQKALQNASEQLEALLGAQGYAAYEQQQYYSWYQPQVLANADGGNLTINPDAFSLK